MPIVNMDEEAKIVNTIFNGILGRDATPLEISRMRRKGWQHVKDVATTMKMQEKRFVELEALKRNAMCAQKVDGVSIVSNYNKKCGIATYTENLYREVRKHIKSNVISSNPRDREDPSDEIGVTRSWDSFSGSVLDDIVKEASNLGNKIVHIQHEFGIFRDNVQLKELINMLNNTGFIVVVTMHTIYEQKDWDEYFRFAKVIVLHTESAASRLYGHGVNNITVIKHGTVSVENLGKHIDKKQEYRNELKKYIEVGNDDILCVSVGFLTKSKLQNHTMMAMREACRRVPNLKCLMIGHSNIQETDYIKSIKDNECDRSKLVEKFLTENEITKLLVACDFSIMNYGPTQFSTSGACRMLMSHGVPSCSSNSRILEDLNPSMSLKFDCNNTYDMSSCIVALALDPSLRKSLGDAAMSEGNRTSWPAIAGQHINLYRSLLRR